MEQDTRTTAETAERATDDRYRKLVDYLDDGFCVVEVLFDDEQRPVDYRFLETNAAFGERTGLRDAVGKRMRELEPDHEALWFERYGQVALTREPAHFDADADAHAHALGRSYSVHAFPVDDASHHHVAILFKDTTDSNAVARERESLLAAERAARLDAESAARAKSDFLAVMSHELRTPINAFVGYVQLLEMGIAGPVTEQQHGYLDRMAMSAAHLLTLVGDVLDLAKIDAGELEVVREHCHTGTAVDAALALTGPQAAARGVTLIDAQLGTNGVPYVGDEQRVRQILANLLTNAIKFTEPGGSVEIGCRLVPDAPPEARIGGGGPWASVAVRDTGIGIAAADQQRIFEEFHQVDARRTRVQGGTGLGLAISRRFARLMGGDLTLESKPGVGSTFTLWLPAGGGAEWGVDGEAETATARGARAHRAVAGFRVYQCAEVGADLRGNLEVLLERYVARLRADPSLSGIAHTRSRVELEDHLLSYLGDFCQALVLADSTSNAVDELAHDGTVIQRAIAELHGRQRQHLGWTERQLLREHELLHEEITRLIREHVPEESGDASAALALITRMLTRAADTSLGAYRRATLAVAKPKAE
ncbi:MAG TPA: ATP-binding protein [Gemmatimonadaceae bacterium]|jgi:signal transduction histidine kinase